MASPSLGPSFVSLSGTTYLVLLTRFPESRGESKDAQESFPALGDRGRTLTQTSHDFLADDGLIQCGNGAGSQIRNSNSAPVLLSAELHSHVSFLLLVCHGKSQV